MHIWRSTPTDTPHPTQPNPPLPQLHFFWSTNTSRSKLGQQLARHDSYLSPRTMDNESRHATTVSQLRLVLPLITSLMHSIHQKGNQPQTQHYHRLQYILSWNSNQSTRLLLHYLQHVFTRTINYCSIPTQPPQTQPRLSIYGRPQRLSRIVVWPKSIRLPRQNAKVNDQRSTQSVNCSPSTDFPSTTHQGNQHTSLLTETSTQTWSCFGPQETHPHYTPTGKRDICSNRTTHPQHSPWLRPNTKALPSNHGSKLTQANSPCQLGM